MSLKFWDVFLECPLRSLFQGFVKLHPWRIRFSRLAGDQRWNACNGRSPSTSFPGSLFFPSPLAPGDGKKRDLGNEVGSPLVWNVFLRQGLIDLWISCLCVLLCLETVSVSYISAVNLIVGWCKFACSMKVSMSGLLISHREKTSLM